ncbi:hypothetical protein GCM10023063_18400 [Arthrobacter methylotrophus]|uniref:DUF222 domain-containing protein n=1 Tax=Arthrobacter methylotrophus TaxID=121291 RepID=A0ABV5UQY0_9MICC
MTTSPSRQPQGIPAGGQFAADVHAEPDVFLASAAAPPKIMASVTLQQWQNDYAIDIETVEFDAGRILAEMATEKRRALRDNSDDADQLFDSAVRLGLVKDHDGPFSVHVQEAMAEAEETDADVYARILGAPANRPAGAVLDTPLSAYEIGARVDEDGRVSGLATMDMSDLIDNNIEGINDKIGNDLVGSELLMEPNATPVEVLDGGTILMRFEGNASAIIEGFDDEERAEYEAGRSTAANNG